jgi:hypothetical protein
MSVTPQRSDLDQPRAPQSGVEGEHAGSHPEWLDHLVELHVLAEHGDASAAAAAQRWIAVDERARQVWESLNRTRDRVLSQSPSEVSPTVLDPSAPGQAAGNA